MNRDSGIAQHGLGPRGGDDDIFIRLGYRVADMPEMSLALLVDGFEVADCRAALRAPVDDVVAAINQSVFVTGGRTRLDDGARQFRWCDSVKRSRVQSQLSPS